MPLRSLYSDDPSQLPAPRVPAPVPTGGGGAPTGGDNPDPTTPVTGWTGGGNMAPSFQLPTWGGVNIPGAPVFNAPKFTAPTLQDAQNEPGYQFRLGAGVQALDHSAAAKGSLRGGNSLKDTLDYGQNFASQEYQNVFNRQLGAYDRSYTAAHDAYAPLFARWQMLADANKQAGLAGYSTQLSNALAQSQPHYAPEPDLSSILGPAPEFPSYGQATSAGNAQATGYPWPDRPERLY